MRIIAVDYGLARTGVAVSDALGFMAGETLVISERSEKRLLEALTALAREKRAGQWVLGLPRHMNGEEGEQAEQTRRFGDKLTEATGLPLVYWDERLTSVSASRELHASGRRGAGQKQRLDAVAAALILEGYLAKQRIEKDKRMSEID